MKYNIEKLKSLIPVENYYSEILEPPKEANNSHLKFLCPFHNDQNNPNLSVHKKSGSFKCFACDAKGDILTFHQKKNSLSFPDACKDLVDKFQIDCTTSPPSQGNTKSLKISHEFPPDALAYLPKRGLTDETIKRFNLGYVKYCRQDGITIPVGNYHKIKLFKVKEKGKDWRTFPKGSKPSFFGSLGAKEVILCAGEWDAMMLAQNGLEGITGPHGESTFKKEWAKKFKDKIVWIMYDLDEAGRRGALNVAKILYGIAKEIKIVFLPKELGKGGDISDFFNKGGTAECLKKLIAETPVFSLEEGQTEHGEYWIKDNSYYREKIIKNALIPERVSNFIVSLERDIEIFDGYEKKRVFKGKIIGQGLTRGFSIDSKQFFNDNKFRESIGEQAGTIAHFKPENTKHIRLASQTLSKIEHESVLQQFGWEREKFLTPSVVISKEGIKPNTETKVDLSEAENAKYLDLQILDDNQFKSVTRHIIDDLLTLQPSEVTYPLVGHTFIAPLMTFLSDTTRPILWLKGITGSGKSFIARLFQCFYGGFLNDSSVVSWTSTTNFIQMVGFFFKDASYLVDDFKRGNIRDHRTLTQLIQSYADGVGRGRLNADSTTKQVRPIRGMMISTGEDVPEHEASILARTLIIEVGNKNKKITQGTKCLHQRKLYSGVMARFIHWSLKENIPESIDALIQEILRKFYEGIEGQQNDSRIARNLALNYSGFFLFTKFMNIEGVITNSEAAKMREEGKSNLFKIRDNQLNTVRNEQASNIFLNTLSELISSGRVSIHKPNMTRWSGSNQEPVAPEDLRNMVGFTKDDEDPFFYILPGMAYVEVQRTISQGGGTLNFSKDTIGRQLLDDGIITSHDPGRNQKSVKYQGKKYRVWVINKSAIEVVSEENSL